MILVLFRVHVACMFVPCVQVFTLSTTEAKRFFSLIYSSLPAAFSGGPLPGGSHRSPSSIEGKKNPGSRMSDHREINTKRCFTAHQRDCVLWLWHLWSPKKQDNVQESAIHSAHYNSVSQSLWAVLANKVWGKLTRSCHALFSWKTYFRLNFLTSWRQC